MRDSRLQIAPVCKTSHDSLEFYCRQSIASIYNEDNGSRYSRRNHSTCVRVCNHIFIFNNLYLQDF